jgi:DNA primase
MYSKDVVAQVLAASDIVEVIGAQLELKPSGGNRFLALCPFHNEKTPSFSVSRERQAYYCFGCEKHGDAITFMVDHEGLSFPEAVQKLADRASITLPAASGGSNRDDGRRAKLIELGKFAVGFYRKMLDHPLKGSEARAYLKTRTLEAETVKRFGLGYGPDGYEVFLAAAREAGFKDGLLESSGMIRRSERGSLYDFFRNRLLVPIRDVSGNVVAFGGRDLSGKAAGKYINTPENALYKKSLILYGLYEARDAIRKSKQTVLVEGYFDLLRCVDAGVENVVATCGTALTDGQAKLIRRYSTEVVLVYDGDAAGIKAASRAIAILTAVGLAVRVLALPDNQDPDDYIRANGAEDFRRLLDEAQDFVAFYVEAHREKLKTIEGRTEVAGELFTIVRGMDDAIRQDEYLKRAAQALDVDEWALRRQYEGSERSQRVKTEAVRTTAEAQKDTVTFRPYGPHMEAREFIAALLCSGELRTVAKGALEKVVLPDGPLREVLEATLSGSGLTGMEDGEAQSLYAAAANSDVGRPEEATELVAKWINTLRKSALDAQEARLRNEIEAAEGAKDLERLKTLMKERTDIRRQRESVGAV